MEEGIKSMKHCAKEKDEFFIWMLNSAETSHCIAERVRISLPSSQNIQCVGNVLELMVIKLSVGSKKKKKIGV